MKPKSEPSRNNLRFDPDTNASLPEYYFDSPLVLTLALVLGPSRHHPLVLLDVRLSSALLSLRRILP